jgi:hypothetical protein
MSRRVLSAALRDGPDSYNVYSTRMALPDAQFGDLSPKAQKIVRFGGIEELTAFIPSPIAMVPDSWDPDYKELFFGLPEAERIDLCGFLTLIIHECQHHFDLLRTPFGLSFHEKLAREYLAFERWMPTLLERPELFKAPLAEWLLSRPPGEDVSAQLAKGSHLDQAMFDLRGSVAFDEVFRRVPPRRIKDGWPKSTGNIMIRGKAWQPITVNRLWLTIRTPWDSRYLGPNEVIEGRTLAMCLLYLTYLLGPGDETRAVLQAYCDAYYKDNFRYIGLLEIQAGMPLKELLALDIHTITMVLHEVEAASWYALHGPVSVNEVDVQQGVATRYLLAGRFLEAESWEDQKHVVELLELMDQKFAPIGAISVHDGLARAAFRAAATRDRIEKIADPEMRAWYDALLAVIGRDMKRRLKGGYRYLIGIPDDGNSLREDREEEGANEVMELDPAGDRVCEWYKLRERVVYIIGLAAEEKIHDLRTFFGL